MPPRSTFSLVLVLALAGCRFESVAPHAQSAAEEDAATGEVWVYTSMYRPVLDALEPVLQKEAPGVTVRWYQAGSEKVLARLEAELAAGGTQADVIATSDPFLYERFKEEGRWLRYVSPNGVRTPRSLVDPDGHYATIRVSTMVLAYRGDSERAPGSFAELAEPAWKDEVVLGDPLTSGTAYTWTVFLEQAHGAGFFARLRANGARVAGGNPAVLQKLEGGEAKAAVLLLENALIARAKGSQIEVAWPSDGAVVIPGYAAILRSTRRARAAQAVVDALLSAAGQAVIVAGDMHAADPRLAGPRGEPGVEALLTKARPWDEALLRRGHGEAQRIKQAFAGAFAK